MANFVLRIPDDLHNVARVAAAAKKQSLNAWLIDAIRGGLLLQGRRNRSGPVAAMLNILSRPKGEA